MEHWSAGQFSDAIMADNAEEVGHFLEGGYGRQNFRFDYDYRPLHLAALYGSPCVLEQLLKAGADVLARIDVPETCGSLDDQPRPQTHGWTARDLAISCHFPSLAARLERAGCPAQVQLPSPGWERWRPHRRSRLA